VGRRIGNTRVFSFSALLIAVLLPVSGSAQTAFVLGGGYAQECYVAVKGGSPSRSARAVCNRALENESLTTHDSAATLVNRGIISLRDRDGDGALNDFNAALRLDPALSAIFLNRAGAYLLKGRWLDAKVDADTALAIGLKEDEWAAHFNRGVALERLGQVSDAYAAFQRSASLAPGRNELQSELARFRVDSVSVARP
jgi:tetratricopeptide (TPR) repeat protein